jgi:hypothetical protein
MSQESLTYDEGHRGVNNVVWAAAALGVWNALKAVPETPAEVIEQADYKFEDGLEQQYPLELKPTQQPDQELPLAS